MRHKKFSSIGQDITEEVFNNKIYHSGRRITSLAIHCSATPIGQHFDVYDIDEWHIKRWGETSGCGYHYVILLDGTIQKGRWVDYPGSHIEGHNKFTIGICYIGGMDSRGKPVYDMETQEQHDSLVQLINVLCRTYDLEPIADVFGHNQFPGVKKSCPCLSMEKLKMECEEKIQDIPLLFYTT